MEKIDENKKIKTLELLGKIISLSNNFSPSAIGCNKPKKPTIFGPLRLCILDIAFLSNKVVMAIDNKLNIITTNTSNKSIK